MSENKTRYPKGELEGLQTQRRKSRGGRARQFHVTQDKSGSEEE